MLISPDNPFALYSRSCCFCCDDCVVFLDIVAVVGVIVVVVFVVVEPTIATFLDAFGP